ncbi:TPA: hypothetical protein ACJ6XF_003061 [Legionella pneumophila]
MNIPPSTRKEKIQAIQKLFNNSQLENFYINNRIKQLVGVAPSSLEGLERQHDNVLDKILSKADDYREYYALKSEKEAFFNQPEALANYEYAARQAYWTIEEGIAWILGKNPKLVYWDSISGYTSSPLVIQYQEIREIAERYHEENILQSKLPPATFLDWVRKIGYNIPSKLAEEVAKQELQGTDWHSCFLKELEANKKKDKEISSLRAEIELLKKQAKTVSSRSERNLLNIIGALKNTLISNPIDKGLFNTQAELIDYLIDRNPLTPGISKSNLENKFSKSNENLEQ